VALADGVALGVGEGEVADTDGDGVSWATGVDGPLEPITQPTTAEAIKSAITEATDTTMTRRR
jgi:hypothetical protein